MLEKSRRITKENEFKNVFGGGALIKDEFISLKIVKKKSGDTRFGFIVGQKVSKSAVVRNKIKRRLRAVVEGFVGEVRPGMDVVVMTTPEITTKKTQEIKEKMEKVFRKAHIL